MRDKLLSDKTVVFTSATLMLGGDFSAVATSVGLKPAERVVEPGSTVDGRPPTPTTRCRGAGSTSARRSTTASRRSSTSPATCRRPGATASARRSSSEIVDLVDAAEGRTLGLFSSRRAAETAAEAVRERLPAPDHARPGRRPAARARQAVRRGPAHLPVRHPQPLAGPRRPRRHLPARDHRPDPVPAARRPADVARGSARSRRPAATASCRSPPPTPRCCSPRAPAG